MMDILAICYLAADKDERNKCSLTKDWLYVKRKNKVESYELVHITNIKFKQKRFLFPLVAGGIISTLFLVAGFNFLINIWLALTIGLAGILIFYYGWVGSPALVVQTKVKEYDTFLPEITPNLKAFVQMVNRYFIMGRSQDMTLYFQITSENWNKAQQLGGLEPSKNGIELSDSYFIKDGHQVLALKPLEISNQINYQMSSKTKGLAPCIQGKIDISNLTLID